MCADHMEYKKANHEPVFRFICVFFSYLCLLFLSVNYNRSNQQIICARRTWQKTEKHKTHTILIRYKCRFQQALTLASYALMRWYKSHIKTTNIHHRNPDLSLYTLIWFHDNYREWILKWLRNTQGKMFISFTRQAFGVLIIIIVRSAHLSYMHINI